MLPCSNLLHCELRFGVNHVNPESLKMSLKMSQGKHEKPSSNRLTAGISEILWQGPDSIWTACVSQVCLRTHLELTDSRCVSAWAVEFVHFFAWVLMFLARVRRFCVRGFPKVILLSRHIVNMLSDGLAQRKFVWPCSWSTAKTSAIKLAVQFCMFCALILGCVYCKVVLCYRNSLMVNRTHFIFVELLSVLNLVASGMEYKYCWICMVCQDLPEPSIGII